MADAVFIPYASLAYHLAAKDVDLAADSLYAMLLTNAYTPNRSTHEFEDDLSGEVLTGNGYTQGGQAITSVTLTLITSASAPAWVAGASYEVGQVVRKTVTNGHVYRCIVAGTSAASEPTWPTAPGQDVLDGTAKWEEAGVAYVKLDFDDITWTPSSVTARYCAVVDKQPGSAATNILVGYFDLLQDRVSANSDFTVAPLPAGALLMRVA